MTDDFISHSEKKKSTSEVKSSERNLLMDTPLILM